MDRKALSAAKRKLVVTLPADLRRLADPTMPRERCLDDLWHTQEKIVLFLHDALGRDWEEAEPAAPSPNPEPGAGTT